MGITDLILNSGYIGYFIVLLAFILVVMFFVGMNKRSDTFSKVYFGLAIMPFFAGVFGTCCGMMGSFGELIAGPSACSADVLAGVYIALTKTAMGSLISFFAVFGACLMFAFSRKEKAI